MELRVGTSGFSYDAWRGAFYPSDLPAKAMLAFYARHLDAVEINNTFYRMPRASVLESWAAEVPPEFRFVLKCPQRITHQHRLENVAEPMATFLQAASVLKERLGPLLFQTPPYLRKNVAKLRDLLLRLQGHRAAFEFRHASWFDDETLDLLRTHRAALCIADADDDLQVPFAPTAEWGYLRLRRPDYGDPELSVWARRIRDAGWRETFVFFKHEDAGKGPRMAKRFLELAAAI